MTIADARFVLDVATKPQMELVDVPEWGEGAQIRVRGMTAADSIAWMKHAKDEPDKDLAYAMALGACDENGAPLFTVDDVPRLLGIGFRPLSRIANKVFSLSGLHGEEAEKKSESPTGDSHSG